MRRHHSAIVIQREWRSAMMQMMMQLRRWSREMTRCVVCDDECVTLFRCENGHGCCIGCDASITDQRCPVCREPRRTTPDDTLRTILTKTRARHLCSACNIHVDTRICEHHRAWCPSHRFTCPIPSCQHACSASQLGQHVRCHTAATAISHEFVLVANRISEDTVLVVDDDVIVISTAPRNSNSLNDIISGGMIFSIRCYYSGPNVDVWTCTVCQIKTSMSHLDDRYVERYNMGIVPAMIASREQIVVAPYTPHMMPCCIDTSTSGIRKPLVFLETGGELSRRLTNHSIRDVPWVTKPSKDVTFEGLPTCVLRVRLDRLPTTPVGTVFID